MNQQSSHLIYRVFYSLLCAAFTLYQSTKTIYSCLECKLLKLSHEFGAVKKTVTKVDKVPTHITLLLSDEEVPSFEDLANVIVWCMTSGIAFVSFYDRKGALKKSEEKLRQVVEQTKNACDHVVWYTSDICEYKNGYRGRKVHVKVLSEEDGRSSIVELTKQFAMSGESVSLSAFNERLQKHYRFPEPDLGVCCGKTFSLWGYPPWQARVTEFLSISSHHNFTFDMFLRLLQKYSRCEQRFGK